MKAENKTVFLIW